MFFCEQRQKKDEEINFHFFSVYVPWGYGETVYWRKKAEIRYSQMIWQVYPNLTVTFFKTFKAKIIALISSIEVPHPVFPLPTDVDNFSLKYLKILEVRREDTILVCYQRSLIPKES